MSLYPLALTTRSAQRALGAASAESRTAALRALDVLLDTRSEAILQANQDDLSAAAAEGLSAPLLSRLGLNAAKLQTLRSGVQALVQTDDPIGKALRRTQLDEGLQLTQVSSPLGVLLVIFESRPDAVVQIASLAIRSGNAVLLKGGREARASTAVLVQCLRDALTQAGLSPQTVQNIEGRQASAELLAYDDCIDLVIPRGSSALVRTIQQSTQIPVLGHAEGICHLYLDAAADPEQAAHLAVDGKCDYPAACNATETLLVHADFLPELSSVAEELRAAGVTLRADQPTCAALSRAGIEVSEATEEDWSTEYGDKTLAVRTVSSLDHAIDHIHRYGSSHTEAICTEDSTAAETFLRRVDSASVFHNASTRFADGYRYGLGAEVGISTGRLHARGPVGIEGLLTTRWLLRGRGQAAGDYGPEGRSFLHQELPLED
jgi:glutamate-5-semialdehyde dehydrogenase